MQRVVYIFLDRQNGMQFLMALFKSDVEEFFYGFYVVEFLVVEFLVKKKLKN